VTTRHDWLMEEFCHLRSPVTCVFNYLNELERDYVDKPDAGGGGFFAKLQRRKFADGRFIGRSEWPPDGEGYSVVCDRLRGHILATIWPQLQLTLVNCRDVFTQLKAIRPVSNM
jgi:hypothetical protein